MVAERDQTPAFFDERGCADLVGMQHRARAREFRRRGRLGVGRELLVAVDQLADVFLQLRELTELAVDLLEERDDLSLGRFLPGVSRRALELACDQIVFSPQYRDRRLRHETPCSANFSFELSSLFVFKTTIVRPFCTTRPAMYSAANPFTMLGG